LTLEDLIAKAEANGFKQSDIVTAARVYHNQPNIHRLTPEQIDDLDRRISAKIAKRGAGATAAGAPGGTGPRNTSSAGNATAGGPGSATTTGAATTAAPAAAKPAATPAAEGAKRTTTPTGPRA
jgi:hypothetical protein